MAWEDCLWFHRMRVHGGAPLPKDWQTIVQGAIDLVESASDDLLCRALDDGSYQQLFPRLALTVAILEKLQKDAEAVKFTE